MGRNIGITMKESFEKKLREKQRKKIQRKNDERDYLEYAKAEKIVQSSANEVSLAEKYIKLKTQNENLLKQIKKNDVVKRQFYTEIDNLKKQIDILVLKSKSLTREKQILLDKLKSYDNLLQAVGFITEMYKENLSESPEGSMEYNLYKIFSEL